MVGFQYVDLNGNHYNVLRLNGSPKGTHRNRFATHRSTVVGCHVHHLTECYLRRQEPGVEPDGFAVATTRYHDVDGALTTISSMAHIASQEELGK